MISGLLKAFAGLCVPRVELWLLGGFDLTPWKTDQIIRQNSDPRSMNGYEENESTEHRKKSFINRMKHFFTRFSQFKYQPLRTEAPQYHRSAVFTLNLVVGVILPIKFGLELARLPVEPCIAACRRQWPLKGKRRKQNGAATKMDGNNFDGNIGRSHSPNLTSKPPYAETESTSLRANPSEVLSRSVVSEPKITPQNQSQNSRGKATPYITSRTSNPRPDLVEIMSESSLVNDKPSRTAKKARTQSDIRQSVVYNQSLAEQNKCHLEKLALATSAAPDVQSNLPKGETPSEKTVSEEFCFCSLILPSQQDGSPLEEGQTDGRTNVETDSRNSTRKQCIRQSPPVVRPQYRRRTSEDSFRGQHFPRHFSARSVSYAADKRTSRDLEPQLPKKQNRAFQQPIVYPLPIAEKCIQIVQNPGQDDLRFLTNRLSPVEDRAKDCANMSTRDSTAQVGLPNEAHKTRDQLQLTKYEDTWTSEPNREVHRSRQGRPRSRTDDGTILSNCEQASMSETRPNSNSPNRSISQGVPEVPTRWRSFHRVDPKPWHNPSAAALVQSLDAVESGTLLTAKPETHIVFSTADPEEQAAMDHLTPFSDGRNLPEPAPWCPISANSSEHDFWRVLPKVSSESSKGEVPAEGRSPERPLGFSAPLNTEWKRAMIPTDQIQLGLNPFSDQFDSLTKRLSNGQLLASSLSAPQSLPQSPSAEEPLTRFHSYLTVMPTVEEENTDVDNLETRRIALKRSSSGSKRTPQGSQENSSCSRSSKRATTKAKTYKIVERNSSKLSRLGCRNYNCATDSATVGTGDLSQKPARRPKPEKARKPSRKDAKTHRKKMEGGVLPEETASTSGTQRQDVIHTVLSSFALPLAISKHANACVSTSDDLCVHVQPKLAIKRSHSFPNPRALPKRTSQSLNKASSEPNVTTHSEAQNDVSKFLLLIKWSKEYYSTNKNTSVSSVVAGNMQLPIVEVHSKELVVRHMSEEVERAVRDFTEHSQLDYCPASKAPSSDRFDVSSSLEEKASKLPYELEALIHRPLLENVGVLPEPFEPCSSEELMYLRKTTQPPLTPEVNLEAVLGSSAPPTPPPRRSTSPHLPCPRRSSTRPLRLPLSSLFPDLPPLPAPRSSPFLPPASGLALPPLPFEARPVEGPLLLPPISPLQVVLDDIESELMHPFQSVLRGRYNSTLRKIRSGPTPPPLPTRGYYPNFQSYLPWEANQRLPESRVNSPYPFLGGNASNYQQTSPTSDCSSRTTVWNGIEPSIQYSNELLKSDHKETSCNHKNTETYSSVKHYGSLLAPHSNYPSATQSESIIRSPSPNPQAQTLPQSYSPSFIPAMPGLPTPSKSFNHLQFPSQPPNLNFVNPVNLLAGLEKATKRANDLLTKTSPIVNANRSMEPGPSQATPLLIAPTTDSKRNEYPLTTPIICLTSVATKQPDLAVPSTSASPRFEPSTSLAPAPKAVDLQASTPTATKCSSGEFQTNNRNRSGDTVSRPSSNLLELPSKQNDPASNTRETTPRKSTNPSVMDTVQQTHVPLTTECLDNEARKTLLANYKEFHRRQVTQMRENINNFKPTSTYAVPKSSDCNLKTESFTRSKPDQHLDPKIESNAGTITLLPCAPVLALMQAPQMQEASSVESMVPSRKERSHKNLSSLLQRELNLDSENTTPHKRKKTRLRKRIRTTAASSSSDTAYHKPSRTKTVRRPSQDETRHKTAVTRLKGPIKVKVKCSNSFSYFTVKERYNVLVSACSSSNSAHQ